MEFNYHPDPGRLLDTKRVQGVWELAVGLKFRTETQEPDFQC
jgi:hypothetical protein